MFAMLVSNKLKMPKGYEEAISLLEEYKKIRISLGKPIRLMTREQIFEDLTGQEFQTLVEETRNARPPVARNTISRGPGLKRQRVNG